MTGPAGTQLMSPEGWNDAAWGSVHSPILPAFVLCLDITGERLGSYGWPNRSRKDRHNPLARGSCNGIGWVTNL